MEDLIQHRFIGYEAGTPTRVMIDAHFKNLGIPLDYVIESSNTATIKQLALEGMGLAFLPAIAVDLETQQKLLRVIDLKEAELDRPITVYWKERRILSRPAQKMLEMLEQVPGGGGAAAAATAAPLEAVAEDD